MFNGLHIEIVWIKGILLGFLYSDLVEDDPYDYIVKHELLFCIYIVGIKITWW